MLFFVLFCACFGNDKYLYLGQTGCDAIGDEAFLDQPIQDEQDMICSNEIPNSDSISFDPSATTLHIFLKESGKYQGFEYLQSYPQVIIERNYSDVTPSIIEVKHMQRDTILQQIEVRNELDLELKSINLLVHINIETLIFSSSENVLLTGVTATTILITIANDYIIHDNFLSYDQASIVFSGKHKIIDQHQVLNGKLIYLEDTNLEYTGKDGYYYKILAYNGVSKIEKSNDNEPNVIIDNLKMTLTDSITLHSFIDADITKMYIKSASVTTLTIDTESTIFLPLFKVINVVIKSQRKIDIREGQIIISNGYIDLNCFSSQTIDKLPLKVIYQIINSVPIACLFSEDISEIQFNKAFELHPFKLIHSSNNIQAVKIPPTHFNGITVLETNLTCADSNCKIDSLYSNEFALSDHNGNIITPEFFFVEGDVDDKLIYTPTQNNVMNFSYYYSNISPNLEFRKFPGNDQTTFYQVDYDINVNSLKIGDGISVVFQCNVILKKPLEISRSVISDSEKAGALIIKKEDSLIIDQICATNSQRNTFSSAYQRKNNKVFLNSEDVSNKSIVINNLASENGELNILNLFFEDIKRVDRTKSLNIKRITSCKGVNLVFQAYSVNVSENTVQIDRTTLLPNPLFAAVGYFAMGTPTSSYYIHSDYFYLILTSTKYSNLYIHGVPRFDLQPNDPDTIEISDVLYINGYFSQPNLKFVTNKLMADFTYETNPPNIEIKSELVSGNVDKFGLYKNMLSPKLIFTNIDSNQNLLINGELIHLTKNGDNHKVNISKYETVILYLSHNQYSGTTLANDQGNIVRLDANDETKVHRTVDFYVISDDEKDISNPKSSLLKFILSENVKNQTFDGKFGYAFDKGLKEKVTFQEGETGEETDKIPDYFPIEKITNNEESKKKSLSGGAIAGIVIGVVAFVAIIIAVIYCCCCKDHD